MQAYPNRFPDLLQKGLQPFYLIFGDEPQQKLECIEQLRNAVKQQGFEERQNLIAETGFNWNELVDASQSMSLFSSRQYIELELPTGKPGAEGSKILSQLAETPNPDVLILIHGGKVGKDVQNTKWFKALDKQGVYVPCYPLEGNQLQQWVRQRMQILGLAANPDICRLVCENCEGNLLAARQELEKLALLYPQGNPDLSQAEQAIVDHSRFNVFQLVDVLLASDAQRAVKMLYRLESEGLEPNIILWALNREWQTLQQLQFKQQQGQPLNQLFQQQRIWKNRQGLYQSALQRLSPQQLDAIQDKLTQLDIAMKQSVIARPYIELCHVCLMFMAMPMDNLELAYG